MDLFEYNKIAGAILFALLVIIAVQNLASIIYAPTPAGDQAYIVEGVPEAGSEVVASDEPEGPSLAMLLAEADSASGQKVAKKCVSCHTFTQGGADGIGPNLWNIVNRPKASGDFTYSSAFREAEGTWTYEDLDGFLAKPKRWMPGTNMAFAGLRKANQRADVIVYLRSLSDAPAPLPPVETGTRQDANDEPGGPVVGN